MESTRANTLWVELTVKWVINKQKCSLEKQSTK